MKTLNDILKTQNFQDGFPVRGTNGYGGEQDGSRPILGTFHVASREEAKKIVLSDSVKLHWAEFRVGFGWHGAVGYWSDQDVSDQAMNEIQVIP